MAALHPRLALSHGQVLWCLAGGQKPTATLASRVRYLRQRGIPFLDGAQGTGRGVRILYDFHQFIELGVAWDGLRQRIEPRLLDRLVEQRPLFQNAYDAAYAELAAYPERFEGDPYTRTGFSPEYLIQFGDQNSLEPGAVSLAVPDPKKGRKFGDLVGRAADGAEYVVIPLKSVMLSLLKLARVAPRTRPGPQR